MRSDKFLEPEIKSLIINHLIRKGVLSESDIVLSEFTVGNAARRVDLAILKGNETWAFEIKSASDSLARLQGQIDIYMKYFDKVFVVVAKKHVESALELIPSSVALWEIRNNSVVIKQKGKKCLIKRPESFIDMMGVPELIKIVNSKGLKTASKRRKDLTKVVLNEADVSLLRKVAFETITKRFELPSKMFFNKVTGRDVTPYDLSLLSRYKSQGVDSPANIEEIISRLDTINSEVVFNLKKDVSNLV